MADPGGKIVIDAPPDAVWAFHEDLGNFLRLNPRAVKHRMTEQLPHGGRHWTVVVSGPRGQAEMHSRCITYEPPRRAVWQWTVGEMSYASLLEVGAAGDAAEVAVEFVGHPGARGCIGYSANQYLGRLRHEFRKHQLGIA